MCLHCLVFFPSRGKLSFPGESQQILWAMLFTQYMNIVPLMWQMQPEASLILAFYMFLPPSQIRSDGISWKAKLYISKQCQWTVPELSQSIQMGWQIKISFVSQIPDRYVIFSSVGVWFNPHSSEYYMYCRKLTSWKCEPNSSWSINSEGDGGVGEQMTGSKSPMIRLIVWPWVSHYSSGLLWRSKLLKLLGGRVQ